jgi:hypothetical protein
MLRLTIFVNHIRIYQPVYSAGELRKILHMGRINHSDPGIAVNLQSDHIDLHRRVSSNWFKSTTAGGVAVTCENLIIDSDHSNRG